MAHEIERERTSTRVRVVDRHVQVALLHARAELSPAEHALPRIGAPWIGGLGVGLGGVGGLGVGLGGVGGRGVGLGGVGLGGVGLGGVGGRSRGRSGVGGRGVGRCTRCIGGSARRVVRRRRLCSALVDAVAASGEQHEAEQCEPEHGGRAWRHPAMVGLGDQARWTAVAFGGCGWVHTCFFPAIRPRSRERG